MNPQPGRAPAEASRNPLATVVVARAVAVVGALVAQVNSDRATRPVPLPVVDVSVVARARS